MRARLRRMALLVTPCLLLLPVTPAVAQASALEVVAEGLDNPRHLEFGPDGDLYVAEAGVGGDEVCTTGPEGGEFCLGESGAVTRVSDEGQERVATGLPSGANPEGGEAGGPHDVSFDEDGNLFVIVGLGADPADREELGDVGAALGQLYEVDVDGGDFNAVADVAAYESEADPDADFPGTEGPDSNPYALLSEDDSHLVIDAGGNDLLRVAADGGIETVAVFEPQLIDAPPFLELPEGTQIPSQAVPTSVEQGPDGAYYVGQLTGFPFPVGGARVYRVVEGEQPEVFAEGFTNVVDVEFLPDGSLVVLELARDGLLSEELEGQLVRVGADGSRTRWLAGELFAPGGLALGPDGALYITTCSVCAGGGQVVRFDPTPAADPAIADACPPDAVPASNFADVDYNVHRSAVECLAWWEITRGVTDDTFTPAGTVDRAQMASFIARSLAAVGVDLPSDAPDAFPDDDFSVHEDAINQLAALGIVEGGADGRFQPAVPLTRAQAAAFLVRGYEELRGSDLEPADDVFADDQGHTHEASINQVAALGWTNGVGGNRFAPARPLRRDQMASFIARMLDTAVEEGDASLPG